MNTQFISMANKMSLSQSLALGDKEAIKIVLNELQRLEGVIKDYELGIKMINDKFESKTFKVPNF